MHVNAVKTRYGCHVEKIVQPVNCGMVVNSLGNDCSIWRIKYFRVPSLNIRINAPVCSAVLFFRKRLKNKKDSNYVHIRFTVTDVSKNFFAQLNKNLKYKTLEWLALFKGIKLKKIFFFLFLYINLWQNGKIKLSRTDNERIPELLLHV